MARLPRLATRPRQPDAWPACLARVHEGFARPGEKDGHQLSDPSGETEAADFLHQSPLGKNDLGHGVVKVQADILLGEKLHGLQPLGQGRRLRASLLPPRASLEQSLPVAEIRTEILEKHRKPLEFLKTT